MLPATKILIFLLFQRQTTDSFYGRDKDNIHIERIGSSPPEREPLAPRFQKWPLANVMEKKWQRFDRAISNSISLDQSAVVLTMWWLPETGC
jgi:hypothetical protein